MSRNPYKVLIAFLSMVAGLIIGLSGSIHAGDYPGGINDWYKKHYYFVTMPDTIYTFESEFILPEGYHHADSSELTDFQNYVANLPMWHRFLPVGNWKKLIEFKPEEISRTMHLPQNGKAMTDRAIPIRIIAEYLVDRNRRNDLIIVPSAGETLEYAKWLNNNIVYGPKHSVVWRPSPPKDTTLKEYYTFMKFCQENTTYKSLTYNSFPVEDKDVLPGDIFVAYDERGDKGVAYVILHMLENDKNDRLYAVGTGCEQACNFYIPLFNNDRDNPWLNANQIGALGLDYPHSGFFRLKIH